MDVGMLTWAGTP